MTQPLAGYALDVIGLKVGFALFALLIVSASGFPWRLAVTGANGAAKFAAPLSRFTRVPNRHPRDIPRLGSVAGSSLWISLHIVPQLDARY